MRWRRRSKSEPDVSGFVDDGFAQQTLFEATLGVFLVSGDLNENSPRKACAAGAMAASRPGAPPSMPTWQEIEDLIHRAGR